MKKTKFFLISFIVSISLGTFLIIFYYFIQNDKLNKPLYSDESTDGSGVIISNDNIQILEPEDELQSDDNFEDITIPYLRQRIYKGKLGKLEKINENENYISYLTSYDSDGLNVNGLLTVPNGEKPNKGWPAIVFVHGYIPPDEYETTKNYVSYVDFLAKNGFVVFKIDLRDHGNSEGEAEGGYYSSAYVIDTLNAHNALLSVDFINKEKIGLWGHSMGGNVIFRAFVAKQDIKAVSIWAGAVYTYSDFSEYGIEDNSYRPPSQESPSRKRRNELFERYGDFDPNNEFWMKVVPTNYLGGLDGVIQVNHAVDDPVVSIEYSRNLSSILLDTNIKYEINEYPTGGHNISGDSFEKAMQDTVDFFKRYLD